MIYCACFCSQMLVIAILKLPNACLPRFCRRCGHSVHTAPSASAPTSSIRRRFSRRASASTSDAPSRVETLAAAVATRTATTRPTTVVSAPSWTRSSETTSGHSLCYFRSRCVIIVYIAHALVSVVYVCYDSVVCSARSVRYVVYLICVNCPCCVPGCRSLSW